MSCCCKSRPSVKKCFYDGSAVRVATFTNVEVAANPSNLAISGLPNLVNANYSGLAAANFNLGPADLGLVLDFEYLVPWDRVEQVRIHNNYGNILTDADGIFNPDVQLFDVDDNPLTPVFTALANNGGAPFVTAVPGAPVDGVARMRMSNIRTIGGSGTRGVREVELMVAGIGPAAVLYCPGEPDPISWVDARTGVAVPFDQLAPCR